MRRRAGTPAARAGRVLASRWGPLVLPARRLVRRGTTRAGRDSPHLAAALPTRAGGGLGGIGGRERLCVVCGIGQLVIRLLCVGLRMVHWGGAPFFASG